MWNTEGRCNFVEAYFPRPDWEKKKNNTTQKISSKFAKYNSILEELALFELFRKKCAKFRNRFSEAVFEFGYGWINQALKEHNSFREQFKMAGVPPKLSNEWARGIPDATATGLFGVMITQQRPRMSLWPDCAGVQFLQPGLPKIKHGDRLKL